MVSNIAVTCILVCGLSLPEKAGEGSVPNMVLEILRTDIKYVCGTCIFIKLIIFTEK